MTMKSELATNVHPISTMTPTDTSASTVLTDAPLASGIKKIHIFTTSKSKRPSQDSPLTQNLTLASKLALMDSITIYNLAFAITAQTTADHVTEASMESLSLMPPTATESTSRTNYATRVVITMSITILTLSLASLVEMDALSATTITSFIPWMPPSQDIPLISLTISAILLARDLNTTTQVNFNATTALTVAHLALSLMATLRLMELKADIPSTTATEFAIRTAKTMSITDHFDMGVKVPLFN